MLFTRQKVLLQFLRESGGSSSRMVLTKKLFLMREETASRGGSAFYEFLPYHFGPFSFVLYHDLRHLERDGLIGRTGSADVALTDAGKTQPTNLAEQVRLDIQRINGQYGSLSGEQIIDSVYERYPWYTMLAKRTDQRRVERRTAEPAVYTIGYEGFQVDGFLNRLLEEGIERLIDVRQNPVARKYGFHRSTLNRLSEDVGIEYLHLPELGIRSALRTQLESEQDFDELFGWYRTSLAVTDVERVAELMNNKPSALMCMEASPRNCHRLQLAGAVSPVAGLEVRHLERV